MNEDNIKDNKVIKMDMENKDIINWLHSMDIEAYAIKNNVVNVFQSVKLRGNIEEIPIQFGVIYGKFICCDIGLKTLKGCPNEVNGDFLCENNQLTSLEGGPAIIGGLFSCAENELTSLEGGPSIIYGDFFCNNNKITSLRGSPGSVEGSFDCSNNDLISLEGCVKKIKDNFNCSENNLTSMKYAPKHIPGSLYCNKNKITSFIDFPENIGAILLCTDNNIMKEDLKNFNIIVQEEIVSDLADEKNFRNKVASAKAFAEKEILLNITITSIKENKIKKRL